MQIGWLKKYFTENFEKIFLRQKKVNYSNFSTRKSSRERQTNPKSADELVRIHYESAMATTRKNRGGGFIPDSIQEQRFPGGTQDETRYG